MENQFASSREVLTVCVWDCVTVGVSDDSSRDMHMHNIAGLCSLQSPFGSMLFQNFNFVFVSHYFSQTHLGQGHKSFDWRTQRSPTFGFLIFCTWFRFLSASRFTSLTFTLRLTVWVVVGVLYCSYFYCSCCWCCCISACLATFCICCALFDFYFSFCQHRLPPLAACRRSLPSAHNSFCISISASINPHYIGVFLLPRRLKESKIIWPSIISHTSIVLCR